MPQMLEYCGRQFTVSQVAHKTCDVIAGEGRRLVRCVHLDVRCDGKAYGGCQAACLIFWKEEWLKPLDGAAMLRKSGDVSAPQSLAQRTDPEIIWRGTKRIDRDSGEPVYMCQATRVPEFTQPLAWWDLRQYMADWRSGNVTLRRLVRGLLFQTYSRASKPGGLAWVVPGGGSTMRSSVESEAFRFQSSLEPCAWGTEPHRGTRP